MSKIISVVLFVFTMSWTWFLFHTKSDLGIDVHAGIQSKLALLIEDTIKEKRPNSTDFKLIRMYTQKVDAQKISASFTYEFKDKLEATEDSTSDFVTQKISGTALLHRSLSEDPQIQKWTLQSVQAGLENIDFKDGLTIISNGLESSETPEVPTTPTESEHK